MKFILAILFILLAVSSHAQTANAGADKTIYLTQTSSTTLDGSASTGTTFLWREISTDYMSGATITNSTSKVATVSGLPQGVFYFEIAATTGGTTKRDSMKLVVDQRPLPKNILNYWKFPIDEPAFANLVNDRFDTTNYVGYNESGTTPTYVHSRYRTNYSQMMLERSRMNGMMLDSLRGKFYTTIEDGYDWNFQGYARSQINIVNNTNFIIDTNKTYIFTWKIYFPQSVHDNFLATPYYGRVTMWDIHGDDDFGGQFGITLARDSLLATDRTPEIDSTGSQLDYKLLPNDSLLNKTHTIRITYREGSASTGKAFIKVEVDGVTKFSKFTGKVGKTLQADYVKNTGLYDYSRMIVRPLDPKGRKFSLVTMDANVYTIYPKPTVDAGLDKSIGLTSTTLNGTADDLGVSGSGVITSYAWTKLSGGTASITSPSSASTGITGLTNGTYQFELAATDNSGLIGRDTVQVTVATSTAAPTLTNNGNQSITVDSTAVGVTATWAAGHTGTYLWTQRSGPSSATIPSYLSAATYVKKLITGTYIFRSTVTQDDGQTAYSDLTITVKLNLPPNARTGPNQIIYLPYKIQNK
jgi:hypothetical protein